MMDIRESKRSPFSLNLSKHAGEIISDILPPPLKLLHSIVSMATKKERPNAQAVVIEIFSALSPAPTAVKKAMEESLKD